MWSYGSYVIEAVVQLSLFQADSRRKGKREDDAFCMYVYCLDAAKLNLTTKDVTVEMVKASLQIWFGNSRDRGENSRKKQQQAILQQAIQNLQQQQPNRDDFLQG